MFQYKVILIHCILFALLCASQFSNWQLLSSDFSKDIALQGIMYQGAQVKVIDRIGCYPIHSVACHGLWSCSQYVCEQSRKYQSNKFIVMDMNDKSMVSPCSITNTKNIFDTSPNMENCFTIITNIFIIMPIITGFCLVLSVTHAIFMHYYSDANTTSVLGYLTMFNFVISRLLMVGLVVLICLYKINSSELSGDLQPVILFNKFFISRIWLIVYSIIELVVGLLELGIVRTMLTKPTFYNVKDHSD